MSMIHKNEELLHFNPYNLAEKNNFKFIGVFSHQGQRIVGVFYNPKPDVAKGYSHYFGVFARDNNVYLCKCDWVLDQEITGIKLPSGKILYSSHRHHYKEAEDMFIDGGRDYIRTNCEDQVMLKVVHDKLEIIG